jgi:hypothetical protein
MIDLLIEKYLGRAETGMGWKESPGGEVFVNPSNSELNDAGGSDKIVRFIADSKAKKLYVWYYKGGYHQDVDEEFAGSTESGLDDFDALWGVAKKEKGKWYFFVSDSQGFPTGSIHSDNIKKWTDKYKWLQSNFNVTRWFTDSDWRKEMKRGKWV